jgi:predicted ATPase/class 3 adenylate cyclase
LLSDIEGSVELWERDPEAMQRALTRHDTLMDECVTRHGGTVVFQHGEGDSRFAVFARPGDAVRAACELQRAFQRESWPTAGPLRVRLALHTGEAVERGGYFYGSTVNRCARLRGLAHGGQILLSEATAALVRGSLPTGADLRDLAEHRLRGLERAERVFQLVHPDLPADFPPLVGAHRHRHNLPAPLTPLLGRERDVARACELLRRDDVRLVTLLGSGGIGKSRVGLQVAADLLDRFPDGVCFVPLEPIRDPGLVIPTIAQVLGLREARRRPIQDTLTSFLGEKQLLLLLDNFEQVLAAAPRLAELLAACARLKMLVTSRAPLHLSGEHDLMVPPLSLPDLERPPTLESLRKSPAVALFVERAAAITPDFALTSDSAAAIAEICHRLDGVPLALELAAARSRILAPTAMLARLDRRLIDLTGGARDAPARHQTLRRAIDWSYELLSEAERRLFRRLTIFVGGFTLDTAARVCDLDGDLEIDVLEGVESLLMQSLLLEAGTTSEPRFVMLETIREYGLEQLDAHGETATLRRRQAEQLLALAEAAAPNWTGPDQITWLGRLKAERDNLRAVFAWTQERHDPDQIGLRLAGLLDFYWYFAGFMSEGRRWLEAMLSMPSASRRGPLRAQALHALGALAVVQGEYAAGAAALEESVTLFREVGNRRGTARSLTYLGVATQYLDDPATALSFHQESARISREIGDRWVLAFASSQLGSLALAGGDPASARAYREESVAIFREVGDRFGRGMVLIGLGQLMRADGDLARAATLYREALDDLSQLGDRWLVARALAGLAGLACLAGSHADAARLLGAVDALREATATSEIPTIRPDLDRDLADVRAALGEQAFAEAWAEGHAMTLEQAVEYALRGPARPDA